MIYYVYGLTEPNSKEYKYIGMTSKPKYRLKQHTIGLYKNPALKEWALSLKSKGLKPQMKIIRKVDCFNTCVVRDLEKKYIQEHKATILNQTKDCNFVQNCHSGEHFSYIKHTKEVDKMLKAITDIKEIGFGDVLAYCIKYTYDRLNGKETKVIDKKQGLYTAKQLSIMLNVSVQRLEQLFDRYIRGTDLVLSEYVDKNVYPKKFTQKTLTLLKQKQQQNSKFGRFRKN